MQERDLDAVFWVRRVPDIYFEDGMFHVAYDVGKQAHYEFVFSPNIFFKMREKAGRIVNDFHSRDEVSQIKEDH